MTPQKPDNSHSPRIARYAADDGYRPGILIVIIMAVVIGGAALAFAEPAGPDKQKHPKFDQYHVSDLPSLGGTNSRGNSINNRDWIAGYSTLPGNQTRHAALWRDGVVTDLGTLGGPNSTVPWSVKNNNGILVGIAQTAQPDPLGEAWSSAAFYGGPFAAGYVNLAFAWERGQMRGLPTLGGTHGFGTGVNNRGQAVGWAENTTVDATCVAPQKLQFRPVLWELRRGDTIHELPLFPGDSSGAATGINNRGHVIGISGICDQAVGRHTAKHAILWDGANVIDLGNLGAPWWNTPTAINERGDIVGFAGDPAFPEGDYLHAFIWTKRDGIKPLGALPGHIHSEAYGINERRQVVGLSCDANFADCRAFIWEDGVMRDLNELKQDGYAKRLDQGKDINDAGEITGRAINPATGERTTFTATPAHGD